MLEGAVARILHQILGKYVEDLDTENLNVGIFSGKVQLTDLKLKPEALFELKLPIEVKAGTIGKIWLQIPWTSLWSQPIVLNVEDVHIVLSPIVTDAPFDSEKNKKLLRAFKKSIISELERSTKLLLGPSEFAERLVSNILNYLNLNITNVHVRYEDGYDGDDKKSVAVGFCIGSVTAEPTNSKWKPAKYDSGAKRSHYLVKIEALSSYWNTGITLKQWDLPSQYYQWRNAMANSLQNYCLEDEDFKFILMPTTCKIKMTITKPEPEELNISKIDTDVIIQDCYIQITKNQYDSIIALIDYFNRMLISWQFLQERPKERVLQNQKVWWRYSLWATLQQRVKPLTWSKIKAVRRDYKKYLEAYKQIIENPNDTELKMDLQQYEDNLNIINIVIARQQARLMLQSRSVGEKSFWAMLPNAERIILCEKIGYMEKNGESLTQTEHNYNIKFGNVNVTLSNNTKEILVATITQTIGSWKPDFKNDTYTASLKIEGLIIEGTSEEEQLLPILSSEHLKDSPAYFFKMNLEKMPQSTYGFSHRLQIALDSVECVYNKQSLEDIEVFLAKESKQTKNILKLLEQVPSIVYGFIKKKLSERWELNLNLKIPYFVVPDTNYYLRADHLLVVDLGRYSVKTELCEQMKILENATQMELEEQLYSKLLIECSGAQILLCDNSENWKDARKEKDTEMHLIPKTGFNSTYALSTSDLLTIPRYKFSTVFQALKCNMSERKVGLLLKFFNAEHVRINLITEAMQDQPFVSDAISGKLSMKYLRRVQRNVTISNTLKYRRYKHENGRTKRLIKDKSVHISNDRNMNEAWARTVDLPGLEDNKSPYNNIDVLLGVIVNERFDELSLTSRRTIQAVKSVLHGKVDCPFLVQLSHQHSKNILVFSRSTDSTDRQYLMLRLGLFTMDVALMTYGPAYQMSINSVLLTDKFHTTSSGQYLDLIYTPLPSTMDVMTVLYRRVSAKCPDFWTHFHGVETSLVANFETLHVLLHQEAIHTIIKYLKYMTNKIQKLTSPLLKKLTLGLFNRIKNILHKPSGVPVPPGSVKFSHSARLVDLHVTVCDSDFDILHLQVSGLELDFLFRANERFVFRAFLSNILAEHMSEITLYSKVLYNDEDKAFEIKYVRNAPHIGTHELGSFDEPLDGSFKFYFGRTHCTFIYKLIVQIQRFVINLDALPFFEKSITFIHKTLLAATDTLQNKTKISLSINVCGPVLLLPQKSSSPNVLVLDTGDLHIENFFKDSDNDVVENILVKLKEITVTRGVMTLTSTLEMQETLIEPLSVKMDIKKYTNKKASQKSWDLDCIVEGIKITLGQRDLSTLMAIYTDNIGEGKILDLVPDQMRSPIVDILEGDDTVRTLEAFFCEVKQRALTAKCKVEEIQLLLFFDSGELLSSPIRDLNHGLCKFSVLGIDSSLVVYTDQSLDGKLSVDTICIEEIGPDVNVYDKIVLSSPSGDDHKSNSCNITVNKPPIVDITFHQNQNWDRSADIIIGRLCLSLSIPFCEKLALFIMECIPKDFDSDTGIINHGYEAEVLTTLAERRLQSSSLTLSIRINRPEIIFLVETTSNKKRYFITKSEILIDFSKHTNRENLVMSLSGLHSLFYDLNDYSAEPYVVLKQCDVEFCKCVEDNSEKNTLVISAIYVRLGTEVVHSINDILNDIVEHFKIPEVEISKKEKRKCEKKTCDGEDMWESKKMEAYVEIQESPSESKTDNRVTHHELLTIPKFEIVLIFELEQVQVLLFKSTVEVTLCDWSYLLNCTCDISMQANYFNENIQSWEPIIDPVVTEENCYRPYEVMLKIFQDKSFSIIDTADNNKRKTCTEKTKKKTSRSYTTTEDEDSGEDMMYIEPLNSINMKNSRRVKTSLSTFLDDSDSENEDGVMEKLAAAISDLFTGDWNEHEDSDCDGQSSENDDDLSETSKPNKEEKDLHFNKCTYVLIDAKDTLDLTITPTFLRVFNEIVTQYSSKIISVKFNRKSINLVNDIGPHSRVELYEKVGDNKENRLLYLKEYENEDSAPNSPTRNMTFNIENLESEHQKISQNTDFDQTYDFGTISSLYFIPESTSQLYDKVNKHFLKIHIPNFLPVQTNCSKRNWEKLVRLHPMTTSPTYHLAAIHNVGKTGRNIIISSPLKIKNETCFALNILYQASELQQLNLEPVGEITNPFETTMRITILEANEEYNVPLYIAYHCKLFVQPAYAEGQYTSDSGIWWRDLATELDTSFNLRCKPKNDSNLEIFSLRVSLRKNLEIQNSYSQTIPNYVIHLLPPLTIHNFLPYTMEIENISLKQVLKVEPGETKCVYSLDLSKDQKLLVKIKYNASVWYGTLNMTTHLDEKIVVMNSENKDESRNFAVNVKCDRDGSCNLFFYTSYWIVNKTGIPLRIRASSTNFVYESNADDILLFTYKRHGKQTLNIQVYESNWSNEFGLECAGTTGLVVCKNHERRKKYLFFMNTRLSYLCPRLTKIVTLLPSFIVVNNTAKALRFMELNEKTDLWTDISPNQRMTFWPETSSMQMYVKYRESKVISQPFYISCQHRTVLRMDKGSAITVEITGGVKESFTISFDEYQQGDAPILVKNYCEDVFLKIQQQDQSPVTLLSPYHSLLYTWDDPTRPRQLVWNVYNNKGSGFSLDVNKDGYDEEKIKFQSVTPNASLESSSSDDDSDSDNTIQNTLHKKIRRDKIILYWLCYREGAQRILLFTQEQRIFENVLKTKFQERCNFETVISLAGIGVSVFTSEKDSKEHAYFSINGCPPIWEVNVGQKWKTLTLELASWIEDKYRLNYKKCQIKDYVLIDFEKMFMLKPFFAEMRRTYHGAVYAHVRKSTIHQYLNLRIHHIQIDNKQTNTIVLYPTPTFDLKEQKPLVDVTSSKITSGDCDVYRFVRVNVGDFYLNIENDVCMKLCALLKENKKFLDDTSTSQAYVNDIALVHKSVSSKPRPKPDVRSNRTIIEYLALSSFGIQLNVSNKLQIHMHYHKLPLSQLLDYLFPYNMSPYMPMEGVHHKISSIEYVNLNENLLNTFEEMVDHVTSQFLQQYYSHVLGLQVLVNSFAIQPSPEINPFDCEKTASILFYGARCLLGHVNMSPAALETCITDIFPNQSMENVQRSKRHGALHKHEGLAIAASSRSFNVGVPIALNQLIVKNHNAGLNCDGEMFFRTTGKALLSLMTRHPDENSDCVEVAKEALRRASLLGEPIKIHQRLTRYRNSLLGLKPFSIYESMGHYLLETISNSRYMNDNYWTHIATDKAGKSIIIVSLQHVIKINKCQLWGQWETEWAVDLDDIVSLPKINCTELVLNMRQNEGTTGEHQIKISGSKELLIWLHEKIEQAIIVSMEDKSWISTENY